MIRIKKILPTIVTTLIAGTMVLSIAPFATAASQSAAVTSARSFPKVDVVKRDLLTESTATNVEVTSHWGGIESLNVPQTQSQAEKDAQAREAAAKAAAERAKAQQAAQAASRGYDRAPLRGQGAAQPSAQAAAPALEVAAPNGASAASMLSFASQFVGRVPYRSAGTTPAGWDCSGFVQYVFAHMGVSLPRTSGAQARVGVAVPSLVQAQPGDIIANGAHAGIYVGGGMVINSQLGGTRYDAITYMYPGGYSIRRVF